MFRLSLGALIAFEGQGRSAVDLNSKGACRIVGAVFSATFAFMSLSQVQIIRSLAEALTWFEKELAWKVDAAELRHLTGRIGELYAAMITRGQMALEVNQRGYDVVSAEGRHITVKTITSSSHVSFRKSTLTAAQDAMILRINTSDGEASIEELFRGTVDELRSVCKDVGNDLQYIVRKPSSEPLVLDKMAIVGDVWIGARRVIQYENGTIAVEVDGARVPVVRPILREIAAELRLSPLNSSGNQMNTRQLGSAIIATSGSENRSARSDSDVAWREEDGNGGSISN
ncbi:MAG: hypothetical protein U1E21_01625 [Reyranellaceae bacterium]